MQSVYVEQSFYFTFIRERGGKKESWRGFLSFVAREKSEEPSPIMRGEERRFWPRSQRKDDGHACEWRMRDQRGRMMRERERERERERQRERERERDEEIGVSREFCCLSDENPPLMLI